MNQSSSLKCVYIRYIPVHTRPVDTGLSDCRYGTVPVNRTVVTGRIGSGWSGRIRAGSVGWVGAGWAGWGGASLVPMKGYYHGIKILIILEVVSSIIK